MNIFENPNDQKTITRLHNEGHKMYLAVQPRGYFAVYVFVERQDNTILAKQVSDTDHHKPDWLEDLNLPWGPYPELGAPKMTAALRAYRHERDSTLQ